MELGCKNIKKGLGLLITQMQVHVLCASFYQPVSGYLTGILHGVFF